MVGDRKWVWICLVSPHPKSVDGLKNKKNKNWKNSIRGLGESRDAGKNLGVIDGRERTGEACWVEEGSARVLTLDLSHIFSFIFILTGRDERNKWPMSLQTLPVKDV